MTGMAVRGINYDVGTAFMAGELSRPIWSIADVDHDMGVIARDLSCSNVNLYGTVGERLVEAAPIAHRHGLTVSLQPRTIDGGRAEMMQFVADLASAAERLGASGTVILNIGCEASIFTRGFLPGRTFLSRIKSLLWTWPFLPLVNRSLSRLLAELAVLARERFSGPLTYSAGAWEKIDWSPFDLVGVNLYRDRSNFRSYREALRSYASSGKPVIVTEVGCATFKGAEQLGGAGWLAADFDKKEMKPGRTRSEQVQADHLGEMLDLLAAEDIEGAYVFDFIAAQMPHSDDPRFDLDMASYGIVKAIAASDGTSPGWEPKAAFGVMADRYRRLVPKASLRDDS